MTARSALVGYVRLSGNKATLRITIDAEAFSKAETHSANDGRQFVSLVANADKVSQILGGGREVTSLCHIEE